MVALHRTHHGQFDTGPSMVASAVTPPPPTPTTGWVDRTDRTDRVAPARVSPGQPGPAHADRGSPALPPAWTHPARPAGGKGPQPAFASPPPYNTRRSDAYVTPWSARTSAGTPGRAARARRRCSSPMYRSRWARAIRRDSVRRSLAP